MTFADQSVSGTFGESISSTQAQYRHMKAMEEIKKKGKGRLESFNKKLEHVREHDRKQAQQAKQSKSDKTRD